ncbi:MAG: CotH kinase family protein [Flavobacteriales bacterium]|nr:CotH kinase family protein [Flavobacteriales bacterium]MBK6946106.1 CotH kinase family protein [Flavobacteriales bacterium]MBK7238949.1 CotH kinase family protein [Flavobacteriales bacterium]MBK9536937.1 CotH kinase family protein [Flavobacteriales bacterium]MBP9139426.1 CotH kinase family protein [Flavobacteriales bacterium]
MRDPITTEAMPLANGDIDLTVTGGGRMVYAVGDAGPWKDLPASGIVRISGSDGRAAEKLLVYPTSVAWKHPYPGLPIATIVRVAEQLETGHIEPPQLITLINADHHGLPVYSILVPEGAFFDPDTGIYVTGNAVLRPTPDMINTHLQSNRWWNYPGNYHFRGKAWQRSGLLQVLDGTGNETINTAVGIRINGQLTRGFPIHALRLLFETPLGVPVFDDGDGIGSTVLLLRSAGNDQMKAMLRDAVAHELCNDLPFDISQNRTCVVYVNGTYWGLHQLRQKVEEEELARRSGVKKKQIAMLEVRNNELLGKAKEAERFNNDLNSILALDPSDPDLVKKINGRLDLNGFLSYMASVMILDNKDWPDANVKFWRYTGKQAMDAPLDGRWYFILTDMDLGLGAYGEPEAPLLERIKGRTSPMPKLFNACMGSPELRQTFISKVNELINGRFSAKRTIEVLDRIASRMEPEMPRHIARWRRPKDMVTWHLEVDRIRTYLRARPERIRSQIPGLFQ